MRMIRKANAADLDALEQLFDDLCDHLATTVNAPGWEKGRYPVRAVAEEALASDCLYVAVSEGSVVGTVTLNDQSPPAYENARWKGNGRAAVVHTLAVHPQYLHCGVGRALMEYAVQWAKEENFDAIHLDTYEKNTPAKGLYEKLGFQFCGKVDLGYAAFGREWYDTYELIL